jgi:hypothetical protein
MMEEFLARFISSWMAITVTCGVIIRGVRGDEAKIGWDGMAYITIACVAIAAAWSVRKESK